MGVVASHFCAICVKETDNLDDFLAVEEINNAAMSVLGESPHWCSITQSLFYIDILACKIHRYIPAINYCETMQMEQQVGFVIPTNLTTASNILLIVGLENSIVEVNFTEKLILRTVAVVPHASTNHFEKRFNDGKCSFDGSLYAGYMSVKWREGSRGCFYTLQVSPSPCTLLSVFENEEFHLPNGMAWTSDGKLYIVDSGENKIYRYQKYAPKDKEGDDSFSGTLLQKVEIYSLSTDDRFNECILDGMTIDAEGMLWVALVGGACLLRIDPQTGRELTRLKVPSKKPTSCAFGKLK